MSSYITIYQGSSNGGPWIQLKLDWQKVLSVDETEFGIIGTWSTVTSSRMQANPGGNSDYIGRSVHPDYRRWFFFKDRSSIFFCNTLPSTGGGAMDLTIEKVLDYDDNGAIRSIFKFCIDIVNQSDGYIQDLGVYWTDATMKPKLVSSPTGPHYGTGAFRFQGYPLAVGAVNWQSTRRGLPEPIEDS